MSQMNRRLVIILAVCMLLSGLSGKTVGQDRIAQLDEAFRLFGEATEHFKAERYNEALPLAKRALTMFESVLGTEDSVIELSTNLLAALYHKSGDYIKAEALYKRTVELFEKNSRSDTPELASVLYEFGMLYYDKRDYVKAEPLYKRALAIRETKLGPEDLDVAWLLDALAKLYYGKEDFRQAEQLYKRALAIREKALGMEHPGVAMSLYHLASAYEGLGDYAQAEPLYKRALAIVEKVKGPEHPEVAHLLITLAGLYRGRGEHAQAIPLYKRALAIREKKLDPDHPDVAATLGNLAAAYGELGDYSQAEPLYRRILAIREKKLGPEHPGVAAALSLLAGVYGQLGDYTQALPLYKRALAIVEKIKGPEHPEVADLLDKLAWVYYKRGDYEQMEQLFQRVSAVRGKAPPSDDSLDTSSLSKLAVSYSSKGDFAQAIPLYKRILEIREKEFGPDHLTVAGVLTDLAEMYGDMGNYEQAAQFYKRALEIREKNLGLEHPDVALSLQNLAAAYYLLGNYEQAERLCQRALEIREKKLAMGHPDVAALLNILAGVHSVKGDFGQAEQLYKRALEILEKTLGPEHPNVAVLLNNLSTVYVQSGDYSEAISLCKRTVEIAEKTLGSKHPRIPIFLDNLAYLYHAKGEQGSALQVCTRAIEIAEYNLRLILTIGSEKQKQIYLNSLAGELDLAVSLHIHSLPRDEQAAHLALTTILQRKGRVLDALTDQIGILRRYADPQTQALLDRLKAARSHLATMQISGADRMSLEKRSVETTQLTAEIERLEDEASRRSAEFRVQALAITLDAVRQAIPPDAALVEILEYKPLTVNPKNKADKWRAPRYVAYVTWRDRDVPQWVELGDAAEIDQDATSWRQTLGNPPLREKNESSAEFQQRLATHEAKAKKMARNLDERVMRPVRNLLGQTRQVLLSPDGDLNLIPFAALVDENEKYLVENYSITYLTSGRDLLRLKNPLESRTAPVVMADPLYDLKTTSQPESVGGQVNHPVSQTDTNRRSMDFTLKTYPRLPGTAQEAAALIKLLPHGTQVFLRADATEAALKRVNRPRLLHIATHGFFEPYQAQDPTAFHTPGRSTSDTDTSPLPTGWENPLLRSGLVLAGVKQKQSGAGEDGNIEDGVVTALEAAGLNLWGTKLVVLSACESGLGQARKGEGIYGLRRALFLAGSETQMMSLWKVSDDGTRDLMTAYYTRLQAGEGRSEALRQVQLAMLRGQLTPARARQHEKRDTSDGLVEAAEDYRRPYYWASFIPSGDWRSMEGR